MDDCKLRIADRRLQIVLLALLCGISAGCSRRIDTTYGQRKGAATYSVNGTAVLGDMFKAAGHDVYSWRWLSPRIRQRADCIVWFPDDFEPPSEEVRMWLEDWLVDRPGYALHDWLVEQPGRTLIYVCRDFDAAAWYWDKVKSGAPPEQAPRIKKAADTAQDDFEIHRQAIPAEEDCEWFTVKGKYQPRTVRTLAGPWAEGIDASKLEIELGGRIDASDSTEEVLLESEGDALVTREQRDGGQLIVIANGSFLLNLPLVNHEHRKLAGKLIKQVGPPRKTVVFLESESGGPPIRDEDPAAEVPTGMEVFFRFPTGWILWHFAAIGIVFCLSRWPIFGLPLHLKPDSTSDFGKHIQALAELLERSGDRAFALGRLAHYQQTSKSSERLTQKVETKAPRPRQREREPTQSGRGNPSG
jgi:hypothetical protein